MAPQLNIMVVEDHDALRAVTVEALRQLGYEVHGIASAEALDDAMARFPAGVFIIDINLPGEDGLSLARRIRCANPLAGIVMASGRTMLDDRVTGYESGADVYLPKPVAMPELLAAVASVGRRVERLRESAIGHPREGFSVDSRAMLLHGPAGSVVISGDELKMLSAFSTRAGQPLEYGQLIDLLGHGADGFRKATLEVKVVRLRKKLLEVGAGLRCIRAVRRVGYQLCVSLSMV